MAEPLITIQLRPPARDLRGRFAKASRNITVRQREMMRSLGRKGVAEAQTEAPKGKTRKLAGSIRFRTTEGSGRVNLRITAGVPYAGYVLKGTRPHTIEGHPLLAFQWHGDLVIVRHVHHPGTAPNPFFERAWAKLAPEALTELHRLALNVKVDLETA